MPKYKYICDHCDYTFEQTQSFNNFKELKRCPQCKKNKLYQDLTEQRINVIGEPTTLLGQAEYNTKKLGKYELESRRHKDELERRKMRRQPLADRGLISQDDVLKESKQPWHGTLSPQESNKVLSTPQNINKYIKEGTI